MYVCARVGLLPVVCGFLCALFMAANWREYSINRVFLESLHCEWRDNSRHHTVINCVCVCVCVFPHLIWLFSSVQAASCLMYSYTVALQHHFADLLLLSAPPSSRSTAGAVRNTFIPPLPPGLVGSSLFPISPCLGNFFFQMRLKMKINSSSVLYAEPGTHLHFIFIFSRFICISAHFLLLVVPWEAGLYVFVLTQVQWYPQVITHRCGDANEQLDSRFFVEITLRLI